MNRRPPLKRSTKPLRRRSPKYGKPRGEWHPQRIRLEGAAMSQLRYEAFKRSEGFCENVKPDGFRCFVPINWSNFELAHVIDRSKGGSDELDNVLCKCQYGPSPCHRGNATSDHPGIQWSKR